MLPTWLTLICPHCKKRITHTLFASFNTFGKYKIFSDEYIDTYPDCNWSDYVMCPHCKEVFNFETGNNGKDTYKKDDANESPAEILHENIQMLKTFHQNLPVYVSFIGKNNLAKLNFISKWFMKRKAEENRMIAGKLEKWDEYYFYEDLLNTLKGNLIENPRLNAIYNTPEIYQKLIPLKNMPPEERKQVLLGFIWNVDHKENSFPREDIARYYLLCKQQQVFYKKSCLELAEILNDANTEDSRILQAEMFRKLGEFEKAIEIIKNNRLIDGKYGNIANIMVGYCYQKNIKPFELEQEHTS